MGRTTVSIIIIAGAAVAIVIIALTIAFFFATQGNLKSSFYDKQLPANGSSSSLLLIQRIPIPNVNGRIDHMAADITGTQKLLFVAEIENNSLDIIDLDAGKRVHTIDNGILSEPQGVAFIPEFGRIFVSNGDGSVDVFDVKSFNLNKNIKLPSNDADNMRYDSGSRIVYVGYGQGALGVINATDDTIVGDIKLTAHPESFQIEAANKSAEGDNSIFVNVPDSSSVAVVDRQKGTPLTTWSIPNAQNNFPMALDESNHR
jgi:DNA-binding beta-propeller fold protein YncE